MVRLLWWLLVGLCCAVSCQSAGRWDGREAPCQPDVTLPAAGAIGCLRVSWGTTDTTQSTQLVRLLPSGQILAQNADTGAFDADVRVTLPSEARASSRAFSLFVFGQSVSTDATRESLCAGNMKSASYTCQPDATGECWFAIAFQPSSSGGTLQASTVPGGCRLFVPETTQVTEQQSEPRIEPKSESRTEPKPEPRPEPKPEPVQDNKSDAGEPITPDEPTTVKEPLPDGEPVPEPTIEKQPDTASPLCTAGQKRNCYSGLPFSRGTGACKEGQQTCQNDGTWGACSNEVLPKEEACGNKLDDDCDGLVDEHCQVECPVGVSKPCVVTLNNPVDWRTDFGFCYILDEPGGMVRDGDFLYLSDTKRHRIMRYDTKTKEMAVLAGTGTIGRTNGPATKASFRSPRGLAVMGRVLYVADTANHLIRAIDLTTYEVSTVAGTGSNGAANGPPLQAQFALPRELAVDPVNRIVYVSDTGNQTIRKIELSGAGSVSVLVGLSGQNGSTDGDASQALFDGPRGLVFDATNSVLYVADRNNDRIRKVDLATRSVGTLVGTTNGHTDGAFQSVRFRAPNGLWLRGSDLYVADTGNHVIRRVDMKNQQVSTIAGTPGKQGYRNGASATDARFDTPLLISRGRNANELFVLDSINGAVRTVDLSGTRQVARLVGPGMPPYVLVPLRCVRISRPTINNLLPGSGSLLVDGDKLYFTENGVDRVFVHAIDLLTRKVKTLAGSGVQGTTNGQGSAASFDRPTGLARVGTTLYLTEPVKHTIRTIDATGTASLLAGTSGTFGSTGTNFSNVLFRVPVSIVSDGLERLYVSDMLNKAIRVLNIKQKSVSAPLLRGAPSISKPQAIVMDTTKNILYLIDNDYLIRKVEISKVTGDNLTTIYTLPASPGMGGQGTLQRIALDTTGSSLYMTVVNGNKGIRILKLDLTANPATTSRLSRTNFSIDVVDGAASQTSWARPVGIAVDSSDNIYVYDELQQRIRVILTK